MVGFHIYFLAFLFLLRRHQTLADHFGDADKASASVESFMKAVIANLDNDWELTGSEIDQALA